MASENTLSIQELSGLYEIATILYKIMLSLTVASSCFRSVLASIMYIDCLGID